jgi:hypothetical protein
MAKSNPAVERQKAAVAELEKGRFKWGLTVGAAFVRGIREIGYKHTGTALDELVDNAYEAGAGNVHVVLNDDGSGRKNNVTQIAVIDDGCGMYDKMIRLAVLWGGTDRENSRKGIGRFGYGLPSASVSQAQRFEVYSMPEGEKLMMCGLDLGDIQVGKYTDAEGDIVVPEPKAGKLPRFVEEYIGKNLPDGFKKGTVVVLDKLDKLTWKAMPALQNHLLEHFGVVYHKLRGQFELWVNGKRVEPIDPLFVTPGYRWYDLDEDRAQPLDPVRIDVKDKDTKEVIGHVNVRFSYMSMRFGSIDKTKKATSKNANERFAVLKEYNGFIIARMGRIIEVVRHSPLTTFMNNDVYIKIEIDFDASLDELFNVPTSKQRVDVSDRIWEILKENGVLKALEQLRKKRNEELAVLSQEEDQKAGDRPSEKAMEEARKLAPVTPLPIADRQKEEARRRLEQEAQRRARDTGKPVEAVMREVEAELGGKPYKVALRSVPGGAFFDVDQIGGTKVLWLNTSSRFFQEVHSGPSSTPAVRAALEILLFSIGDRMLEGRDELRAFYTHEIPEWSRKLEYALAHLAQNLTAAAADDAAEAAA